MTNRPIAQAAKIRAAVLALIPQAAGPVTIRQITQHPALQALDATIPQVTSTVLDMYKSGSLTRVHTSLKGEPNTRFAYEAPKAPVTAQAPVKPVLAEKPVRLPPDVRLDFIKSTGRLRIEFRGLRVELGAVD